MGKTIIKDFAENRIGSPITLKHILKRKMTKTMEKGARNEGTNNI